MNKKIQAIILAAGKSTRMWPLSVETPKPLLKIIDKPIIEYTLERLAQIPEISEVIIVVNFHKEKIIEKLGSRFKHLPLNYVFQEEADGSGGALLACQDHIEDKFIVLNGDDLYQTECLTRCLSFNYAIATVQVDDPSQWGIVEEKNGYVRSIVEKPTEPLSDQGNIGIYVLDKGVFRHQLEKTTRGEYEITDYIKFLLEEKQLINCVRVEKDSWIPVGNPWQYLEASQTILSTYKFEIQTTIDELLSIKGPVYVGRNTQLKPFSVIEGPVYIGDNCIIGPHAHIRPGTIIMDDVRFGGEVVASVLMDNVKAKHSCYLGYTVIGPHSNIGAGTVTSDYRHDGQNHYTILKGQKVDTGRRKLGSFLGEAVKTGINTSFYPGIKMAPRTTTLPGETIKKDIF